MKNVLYIKANPKSDNDSRTFQVANAFIEEYKKNNPEDKITTIDLYSEDIHSLTLQDIAVAFGEKTEQSKNTSVLKYTYQFAQADKYIIAEPLWNLGVPAILKQYFDYVTVKDITFKYTESGAVGLLKDKKAVNITSRGGIYSQPPMSDFEMGDRYVRTLLGFLGVQDYQTIVAEGLDMGLDVDKILAEAKQKAVELAKKF